MGGATVIEMRHNHRVPEVAMNYLEVCGIRTRVPRMMRALEQVKQFARLNYPLLIQGETGTGKELVAGALHALSHRASKPMVIMDCGAVPESLAESELFGYERGSFTGAERAYTGRIDAAAGGTLFLDEICSLSVAMQAKLLRFLECGEILRIGRPRPHAVDARVVGATNVPLKDLLAGGRMRADFAYRLNVLRIDLPPLRERVEDVPLLVEDLLARDPVAGTYGITSASDEVLAQAASYPWPGNVRELRNVLRRSLVSAAGGHVLRRLDLEGEPATVDEQLVALVDELPSRHFRTWIREREREYFAQLIEKHPRIADQVEASGLPQRTFYRKVRRLGLIKNPGLPLTKEETGGSSLGRVS